MSVEKTTSETLTTVGFALIVDRAVASVRYSNGSMKDVVDLKASAEYIELMRHFSSPLSEHPSPRYDTLDDMWTDWPRQIKRSARKKLGLAASSEVAVIARVLKRVADVAKTHVDSPISCLISFPALPGLYQEDVADAAYYLGLRALGTGMKAAHPHEDVAVYAGNGLGLCEHYDDAEQCREEEKKLPVRDALLVEYTESALLIHRAFLQEAEESTWKDMRLATSFELGSAQQPDESDMHDFIHRFLYRQYCDLGPGAPPDTITVMISGSAESVSDGKVQRAITRVIESIGAKADMLEENPSFMAARGAAELAWRAVKLAEYANVGNAREK